MRLLHHMLGFAVLVGIFYLGRLLAHQARKYSDALACRFASRDALRRFFLGTGRTVEVAAAVCGFLEAVAILVLAT